VRHFALSAFGRDRPGIVAGVTEVLLDHGVNVEDSQMTILRGNFTMMLILAAPAGMDRERLARDLDGVAERLALEAVTLREVEEVAAAAVEPSHMVTVYGVDHPGIVHAAATVLADRGVNITDLNTRLLEDDDGEALYALLMEVSLPDVVSADELSSALAAVAEHEGVEVSVRELEQDTL
jgi:glycine cleavage system transcriptional repressor